MWSYYGDGHKGVAIGVEITDDDKYDLIPVKYRERAAYVSKSMDSEEAAKKLLSTKLLPWEHEQEVFLVPRQSLGTRKNKGVKWAR